MRLGAAALLATGCLRTSAFVCESSAECAGGTCEASGYCSFADASCASGRRYGEHSGPVANQCAGDEPGADAALDAPPDAAPCPASYTAIGAHVYGKLAPAAWGPQRDRCTADHAYLVVPDDATELAAVQDLAGGDLWVGVSDSVSEGAYVTVFGTAAAFLPWAAGQPDDNPGAADCVLSHTARYYDDRCTTARAAVCECAPP